MLKLKDDSGLSSSKDAVNGKDSDLGMQQPPQGQAVQAAEQPALGEAVEDTFPPCSFYLLDLMALPLLLPLYLQKSGQPAVK